MNKVFCSPVVAVERRLTEKLPQQGQRRTARLANGRLAMVAIAFAAFFEAVSGAPVTTLGGPALFVGGLGAAAKAVDLAVPNETKEQIKKDLGL